LGDNRLGARRFGDRALSRPRKAQKDIESVGISYPGRQFLSSSQRGPNPLYELISVVNKINNRRMAD